VVAVIMVHPLVQMEVQILVVELAVVEVMIKVVAQVAQV
jgi:hypothetical protein